MITPTRHSHRGVRWLLGIVILAATAIANAEPYVATYLGTLGGGTGSATAINNEGTIVGESETALSLHNGFSYTNGTMTDVITPGGQDSFANGINDAGTIVGSFTTGGSIHAFTYSKATMTDLGTLGGSTSIAYGINNSGAIVGVSDTTGDQSNHAFVYNNGTMTDLGTLGGSTLSTMGVGPISTAKGINDAGTIVGDSSNANGPNAFSYSNGTMTNLGTLGGPYSSATAINAEGTIVGTSSNAANTSSHAFSYSNGKMSDLGDLNGYDTYAAAINNQGTIVGYSTQVAFIYQNGVMTNLNTLVNLNDTLIQAVSINDSGQIVANSYYNAYLLTPTSGAFSTRLINISTRAQVGTGSDIMIPGFVIRGNGTETLLIRADGPSLSQFSVPGVLANPILSVFDNAGAMIASNTGWSTSPNPSQIASVSTQVGAFPLTQGSADCALIVSLPAGAYTVHVSGLNNTSGVALAEVYEVSSTGTRLVNISTRAQVGTGANIIISGFVVKGAGVEQVLARADGPGLTQFGVTGVLAQPSIEVLDSAGTTIASNTDWDTRVDFEEIESIEASAGAFPLVVGRADSAAVANIPAGAHTMLVSGVNGTTGVALAEIYEDP